MILDYSLYKNKSVTPASQIRTESIFTSQPQQTITSPVVDCTGQCLLTVEQKIQEATKNIKFPTAAPQAAIVQPTATIQTVTSSSQVKELYIPLGTTSSSVGDWTDTGIKVNIDSTKYTGIKSITFEGTIEIPTGNETAYARLFNETDKHPVWNSDISVSGGGAQYVTSQAINLDSGNKLYSVQMNTSLKYLANLTGSRIHIIFN